MTDLHEAFTAWLLAGAREDLPRDVALHASACSACIQAAAATDALALVDPGAAELPPLRVAAGLDDRRRGPLQATAGATVVLLVIAAGIVAGSTLFRTPAPEAEVAVDTPSPGGAVLGGQGGPSATARASETPGASPTSAPTASPDEPSIADPGTPNPTMGGGPPPVTPTMVPATPRPTARPTATPQPATPGPTPQPTPVPTPVPTPTPTPIPPLPACSDGEDNDGDLLIDFPLDPGCTGPADDDEADSLP